MPCAASTTVERALLLAFVLALSLVGPVAAQTDGDGSGPLVAAIVKAFSIWFVAGLVTFVLTLMAAGRSLGLPVGPIDALWALIVGVLLSLMPNLVVIGTLGERLGEQLGPLVLQMLGLCALAFGVKWVFKTDFVRAVAALLLASIATVALGSVAMVLVY